MRESLVCLGTISDKPYCFSETGVPVSSYEELCYYFRENTIFHLGTLPDPAIDEFILNELGLPEVHRLLLRARNRHENVIQWFETLFHAGNYLSDEEIREFFDNYRRLSACSDSEKYKLMGDAYMRYNKTTSAIRCYQEALKKDKVRGKERGDIYHNLGVARSRLFRFKDAAIAFVKAYQYNGSEKSLFHYYSLIAMTEGEEKAKKSIESFHVADLVQESFTQRYHDMQMAFENSNRYDMVNRLNFVKQRGDGNRQQRLTKRYIRTLQSEFRNELI